MRSLVDRTVEPSELDGTVSCMIHPICKGIVVAIHCISNKGHQIDSADSKIGSFVSVGCLSNNGFNDAKIVKCYGLLQAPDELCGLVEKPTDILQVKGNRNIIQADEWRTEFEPDVKVDGLRLAYGLGFVSPSVPRCECASARCASG